MSPQVPDDDDDKIIPKDLALSDEQKCPENDEVELSEEEELISSDGHDYDTESSDFDDSDLLKRLDAKYGKLPPVNDNDDIDDEDIDPTWTSTYNKFRLTSSKATLFLLIISLSIFILS